MSGPTFEFATATRIVFGPGRAQELPALVAGWGERVVVLTGSRPDRHRALIDALPMDAAIVTVSGEPTVGVAREAVAAAREHGAQAVVSLGGGSVIDLGKTVAMLLGNGGDPLDYLEVIGRGQPIGRPSVPFAAVPTTAGTGAEVTMNAVLASPEHGRKASVRARSMLPALALVDPLLTVDCPPAVTAASGLDALTQCLEPLVSRNATPITDALAAQGLRHAAAGLRAAYADGTDVAARTEMALCSLLGGLSLANAKLGAVHGFAGVIGGLVPVAHGAICAALLAPVTEANVRALRERAADHPALAAYRQAAELLTGRSDATVEDGVEWIAATVRQLGITGLAAGGLDPALVDEVVDKTGSSSSTKGNPIELTPAELRQALVAAL
ncbi:iron-containing alcohol dehydrogenase [Nakamurella multipartita]|uniref:Iron-containing alcohol dehydrogenase n=1 Tax=Nakamurella multipartita (strain ATCC 700099 / DSM 44233 / CIP 104796 / JCM 9543 / NBRC 105858 / Y-104) TaxID=479431 RepID=C8X742_NAKMY|nr:iron-containing alcohol dehydrogenase [Nakamurella multipartita]ACV76911.1 iron-containing alcohol dehydrogenase [Nakamurella multipartita DSM 44233]